LPQPGLALAATPGNDLTSSRFARSVATPFDARALSTTNATPVTLLLREVRPLSRTAPGMRPEVAQERSFELVFTTEAKNLAQDTYEIVHPDIGTFVALLVPSRDGKQLSAIFNRLP
jgi:hypothetical protein